MRRLTYENSRGESIEFYQSPFLIESLTGIGEVDANLQSQKSPYQDGDTYIDSTLEPRYPTLEGVITETNLKIIKEYRHQILRVCNPKLGLGKLTLEIDGDIKEIYGVLDGVPSFPERGNNPHQRFMIVWKCPDPYWKDIEETNEPLASWIGSFEFPFEFPVEFGEKANRVTIENDGDAPAPVLIEFHGPASNPIISNETTGEFLKVNRSLSTGEVLQVNTAFGEKTVEIVAVNGTRTNVFNYIDPDSSFFHLLSGENDISFNSDDADISATVSIKYKKRYIGV